MKKITAYLLLTAFIMSFALPAAAQKPVCFYRAKTVKTRSVDTTARASQIAKSTRPSRGSNFASFDKVRAIPTKGGNVIQWQMDSEQGNLGFYVYREDDKGRVLVNDVMTTGSSALVGNQPMYGQTYSLNDPAGTIGSRYFVEAVGPYSERVSTDPVAVLDSRDNDSYEAVTTAIVQRDASAGDMQSNYPARRADQANRAIASDLTTQRWIANQPGAKIAVRTEGLYRVHLAELNAASPNLFSSGNASNWRLFKNGIEQAVLIGSDGNGPYVDFYGRPMDTRESGTTTYYMVVDPSTLGLRMVRPKMVDAGSGSSVSYSAVAEKKERNTYIGTMFNGDAENWWGRPIGQPPQNCPSCPGATVSMTISGIDFTQPSCLINVKLQGWSQTGIPPSVRVTINGNPVGDMSSNDSQVPFTAQFTIPTSSLLEGTNTLGFTSLVTTNTELFDTFTVTYARKYAAVSNRLLFSAPTQKNADLTGFTSPRVRLFNVQTEDRPAQVGRITIVPGAGGTYTVNYPAVQQFAGQKIFAVEDTGIMQSPSVVGNNPSNLSSSIRNADFIVISYSPTDFMAAANTWAAYRHDHDGANVVVVDIADILDEFSYGALDSTAVRDFLQYAHTNWPSQQFDKQYVLLLGDASVDPRNYWGLGNFDQVPTMIVTTVYAETGSDDALADFDGDGLAEMAVGRVPFRSAAAITAAFNKTVNYEAVNNAQSIDRGALFAYDVPNGYDFGAMSQELASQLPASMSKAFIHRGIEPTPPYPNNLDADPQAHSNLMAGLNGGKFLVNFSGHGAQSFWGASSFLNNAAINNSELANGNNQSIFTMLTCLNGYFVGYNTVPGDESIAELLLKSSAGGGPAAWASTGLTTADVQMTMGREFMTQIGVGNIPRMGDLIREAKGVIPYGADVRFSWALFGDPMLKVR